MFKAFNILSLVAFYCLVFGSGSQFTANILTPIKCLFYPRPCWRDEHGAWNFPREEIKAIVNGTKEISNKLKLSSTKGLDTDKSFFNKSTFHEFKIHVQFIFPGTKWCGEGDIARNYTDLGFFAKVDACCRDHDNFKNVIKAGKTKYGLKNTGLFTRSECTSDRKFYSCLHSQTFNPVAKAIGFTYFSIVRPQCFEEDFPLSKCYLYFK